MPCFLTREYARATLPTRQRLLLISAFAFAKDLPTSLGTLHLVGAVGGGGGVCDAIEKLRETGEAAFQFVSPGCAAVIEQLPAPARCTLTPETVHLPAAAKLSGRPDDALALTRKSGSP